ncbi:sensor histidine kinase [Microbispora siamensis]|uniref:histidine kinase n=1 Tax=Microbispora siamensis TaxID=564413 RepID=A0ABQ4H1C3_9ACTN|nr:sensor histidine kinase [Microbispora siamensis]GIH67334.1 two-component sensor histidine kinase [Microbispora siamensis]
MDDPDVRPLFPRPLRPRELVALDVLAGLGYAFVLVVNSPDRHSAAAWALVAAMTLPLAVRRRWPLPVFCLVAVASVAAMALGVAREPLAAAAYALYPVALTTRRRRWEPTAAIGALTVGALLLAVLGGVAAAPEARRIVETVVLGSLALGGAWTIGRAVRERRAYAARRAEQAAEHAVTEERLRIAREMHDVVSHTLSLIGVKAGVAAHVADRRPEEALEALRVIETTSRQALTEMRHMLGVLRTAPGAGTGDTGADTGALSPAPGLAALPDIAERAAAAGVRVDLDVRVTDGLPPALELAVHRIVQESVTNVVRHAAPAACRVLVDDEGGQVRVEVTDDGPGRRVLPAGPPGHGVIGMRERVAAYGGVFTAGPLPGGGFRVLARLPLEEERT